MAELSQFLNSGGKQYRLASSHQIYISSATLQTQSITPASDEFALVQPRQNITVTDCTLTAGGRDITPLEEPYRWNAEYAKMGLGEQISLTNKSATPVAVSVLIYEEDA